MRKQIFSLMGALALVAGTAVAGEAEVKAAMETTLGIKAEAISPAPIKGLYEVVTGQGLFYVTEDGSKLIHGQVYDLKNQMANLTEQRMSGIRKELLAKVADTAIEFKAPNEKHVVTVFTDTTCGYCRKLHNEMQDYLDAGITIRYLAYPRGGANSGAWREMEKLWCAKDPKAAMGEAKAGQKLAGATCPAAASIAKHYELGNTFGVNGTPAMVLDDGTMVPGYLPASRLQMQLSSR
ncbi:bifunctional protein-disulfide isomerase/oxidoreductase DsbC [Ferrimonas futtsuensis]|uniref:bifunctional protein-disulfide isomerase/oxidoreductase DsbC n=1 Tax=Ferrimonas futtsuensis TaxID=364764 RepID=UPI0003FA1B50|nr:bifunctional protein-disulfide isomerase/oxidoreductase DsbC [Ferrimonas futtsuensis]